jgi:glycosyltransferase involved in cell wall biosynthesis
MHGPHIVLAAASHANGPLVTQIVDPWSHRSLMEAEAASGWRRGYWKRVARNALAAERGLPERARLLTVGRQDAERWSAQLGRPVRNIGVGASVEPAVEANLPNGVPTICFVGGLNYAPNIESAQILVREIAPLIWSEIPDVRVVIAGRQPDASVLALESARVSVLGNVPSVEEIFRTSHAAVFPDRHGLGVRNSVIEALAVGVPVFATPIAAREQPEHPHLHVAEDSEQLARLICAEIRNPQDRHESPLRGWDTVAAEYEEELSLAQG